MSGQGEVSRSELQAAVEARRELGQDYEPALIDSFLDKVDRAVTERAEAQVRARGRPSPGDGQGFVVALVSLGVSIPVTAIAGGTADLPGVVVAWIGLVGINVAHAWGRRRPDGR